MIRATLTMRVRPGREAEFERAWARVAAELRRSPGNLRQALLRDPADPAAFVITSDWDSEDAFRRFERSDAQDRLTATIRALRESATMTVHRLVRHVDVYRHGLTALSGHVR